MQGYAAKAPDLQVRYESFGFEGAHQSMLHLLPRALGTVLDIGAGTGRDAAYFATKGHRVVAVEPTDALRNPASELHPSPSIDWIDDGLPELGRIIARQEHFDMILMSAVWMHLDAAERRRRCPSSRPCRTQRHHDHDTLPRRGARGPAHVRGVGGRDRYRGPRARA